MPSYTFTPMTPTPLVAQSWTWHVPLHPSVAASATSVSTWFGTVGFSVTGLPIYAAMEGAQRRGVPDWAEVDREALSGRIKILPSRADITMPINEKLIVELYSK
jgi:ribosomal protein S4